MKDKGQRAKDKGRGLWTRAGALVLCLLSFVHVASAAVVINEVQSSNDGDYTDEFGQDPDWVELHNTGFQPVALGGWFLTDKPAKPEKWWRIPDGTTIAAKGYLVIACDGRDTGLHAKFSISGDGDTIALFDGSSNPVDQIDFGMIPCDRSYGRKPDGGDTFAYFATPTPKAANANEGYLAPLEPVTFSVSRRICTEAFDLELSHPSNGVKIVYTLDHSDPTETHGTVYDKSSPIRITKTTNVKAAAFLDGHLPYRNVTTHTYVFLDQVAGQGKSSTSYPDTWYDSTEASGYTDAQKHMPASYGLSTSILGENDNAAKAELVKSLKAAPIVSITMDDEDLFGSADGIYTHPCALENQDNETRQADIEWLTGENVLGSGAGLSVHGGHSRYFTFSVKKSFTLRFRGRYGAASLEAPVMKDAGNPVKEFRTLILRAEANHHWTAMDSTEHSRYPERGTSMHDQFIRNTQKLMSGYQAEGTHVHLFLNGMYWGLYNLTDQVCDSFAASTWGGEREDYNVVKYDGVKDGSNTVYTATLKLAGNGIDTQADYEALAKVFDIDAYIDYVILETFIANEDWAKNNNNWVCSWSDALGVPIRYVVWDADMSLREVDRNVFTEGVWSTPEPLRFHASLKGSDEYKLRFADRIHRFFYNDGILTPTSISNRYAQLAARVRPMVFGESARWGAYQYDNWDSLNHNYSVRTLFDMDAWDAQYTRLTAEWFPERCTTYLTQVSGQGLYPSLKAAEFTVEGRTAALRESPGSGVTVYYTTDGSDPRIAFKTGNSSISSDAKTCAFGAEIAVGDEACVLKARAYQSGTWSALSEVEFGEARGTMNRFKPTENGENWDEDANWSWGYSPNAAGETARIGVPTAVKKNKTWRNIHVNSNDVTVGFVEVENGGWTNRIDTGDFGGNLIFDGGTNETGKAVDATFTVTDAAGPGLTMIDLDPPNVVRLDSDISFDVGNAEGSPDYGGLLLEGAWDCGGHNLKKTGAGRLTIAFTNAARTVAVSATGADTTALGKLQCEGGITAVETPIQVESITKSGTLWVQMGSTNLEEAVESAVASADSVKPFVGLFAPTDGAAETNEVWYGGIVAKEATPQGVTVYVPAKSGAIGFCGRRWKACPDATWALATNDDGRVTFQATIPPPPPVQVWINEIQSSNDQTIKDERGEDSDWVELYNAGDEAVDLSGWGLSDKKSKPYKWTFPSGTVLAPGAYLLVFCDEGESGTHLHASFSLSGSGETLTLTDTDGRTVDQVEFGEIPCDTSYGRTAAGDGDEAAYAFFSPATPGAANAEAGYAPPPGPVCFSKERGLYEEPFAVTLSNADVTAEIWYTTDHSDPSPTNKTAKPYKGEAISITGTTILRATAVKTGCVPCRNIQSQSYIFLSQVADQVGPACASNIWSDAHYCSYCKQNNKGVNGYVSGNAAACPAEYGISKTIVNDTATRQKLVDALSVGTVLSITMSDTELFDPDTGLHSHPNTLDIDRAASIEWVTGNHVFGTDCGVAMQGGWARHFEITPKKSFRLKFRGRFGTSKLEVPVMDDVGCEQAEFKDLILRGENNQSWGRYSKHGTSMADQVLRDVQGEMSGYQSHGTHVHLFLNGLYWGVYNLCERGDANFAATATGWGGNEADWDVLKHDDGSPDDLEDGSQRMDVRDGSAEDFTNLVKWVKAKATASISQTDYLELARKIDLDAFIDYYILQCYIGNHDWPENNWVAMMSTKLGQPLRYLAWDLEYALEDWTQEDLSKTSGYAYTADNLHLALVKIPEYRLRFADRVHKHFYNNGALTEESLKVRYSARADLIGKMIFAESARWGAYYPDHRGTAYEVNNWKFDVHYQDINDSYKTIFTTAIWETEYNRIMNFFGSRWSTFKGKLTGFKVNNAAAPLYPSVEAAEFDTNGVDVLSAKLTIPSVPSGKTVAVYYTTDGSDPREAFTGTAVGTKYTASQVITVEDTATLKSRALMSDGTWSALSEIELVNPDRHNVFVSDEGKDATWTRDESWSLGQYPNGADAIAVIGAPTAGEVSKKGQRKVTIGNGDGVTVGQLELTDGDYINRIEAVLDEKEGWYGGDLRLCGVESLNDKGEAETNATIAVMDADGAVGQAVISLDPPWVVRLDSDLVVYVTNTAASGGLRIEGAIAGNGHDFKKTGPGRLTLACTNAVPSEIGKLQCEEGILAVETPITVGSITKKDGTIWVKAGEAEAGDALRSALVSRSSYNDKLTIGLFVPTACGSETRKWYGGLVADNLATKKVTVYVQDATGDVAFAGEKWSACPDAEVETAEIVLDDGVTPSKTYQVKVPYFGPLVEVTAKAEGRGSVEGAGPLIPGTDAVLTAVPETGWTFMGWTVGGTNATANPLTLANVTNDCEVTAHFGSNGGTVGGVDCATVEEAVKAAIRTGQPIVFPVKPTVDRAAHTISAPEGGTATVSWWNDIVVSDDGLTVSFELVESVRNPPPQPVTRMTWRKGVKERVRLGGTREDGDGNVVVSVKTIKGLSYALGQDGVLAPGAEWTPGNGGIRDLTAPKSASGEYEVLVKDSERD